MNLGDEEIDGKLRGAFREELPDTGRLEEAVLKRIAAIRLRYWFGIAAAILAVLLGYCVVRPSRLYRDAARDHRLEVIEPQPRHWRTDPAEIAKLSARFQLPDVASLAPAGYRLERAKMCGLEGRPALHVVYGSRAQEFSVYFRAPSGGAESIRAESVGREQLAAFQNGRVQGVIATTASSAECVEFAKFINGHA
jgi:anti-sigma factor RsiW